MKYFVVVVVIFLIYQIFTVDFQFDDAFTPLEIDQQITRMNYYPPKAARLGYILEHKREVQTVRKIENDLFNILDTQYLFRK